MSAARGDLRVQRWAPARIEIPCEGFDFAGNALTMQVREYRDAPGEPLINLADSASPAEGLSVTVAVVGSLPTSTIAIRINETTLENVLPYPANGLEKGADVVLTYAIHVGSGAAKFRLVEGSFTIEAGANQA